MARYFRCQKKKNKQTNERNKQKQNKRQNKTKIATDLVRKTKKALFKRSFAKLVVSPIYLLKKMVSSRFLAEKKNIGNEHSYSNMLYGD